MSHKYISLLSLTLSLTLTLLISFDYLAAWSVPPGNPPSGNIAAPLNTSATSQQKDGVLGVMSLNAALYGSSGGIVRAENQMRSNEYCDLDGLNCIDNFSSSGGGAPVGSIAYMAGNVVPTGYLAANGQAVSRTTYAALFAVIGTRYGAGNGATTFNLPDLRGEFVRGWDAGRGVDSGRSLGSFQNFMIQSHDHGLSNFLAPDNIGGGKPAHINFDNYGGSWYRTDSTGGHETRPRNIALYAVIKAVE